jgi:biotin transport system substrate-specific component
MIAPAMSTHAAAVRATLVPRSRLLVDALLVLAGTALVAVSAQISVPLPFTPVPITGQTFAVVLVGAALGALRGTASLLLYVGIGILGAPVYADQSSGWEVFTGPTGGYLVGFILAALLTGRLAERRWDRRFPSSLAAMLSGNVLIYVPGLLWLAHSIDTDLEGTLEAGLYPFVVGDLLKLYLAGALLPVAWRLVERVGRRP